MHALNVKRPIISSKSQKMVQNHLDFKLNASGVKQCLVFFDVTTYSKSHIVCRTNLMFVQNIISYCMLILSCIELSCMELCNVVLSRKTFII